MILSKILVPDEVRSRNQLSKSTLRVLEALIADIEISVTFLEISRDKLIKPISFFATVIK